MHQLQMLEDGRIDVWKGIDIYITDGWRECWCMYVVYVIHRWCIIWCIIEKTFSMKRTINTLLVVCSYHVMYAFQNESTFYSCLNVKELLARNRHDIWSLSDWNGARTHKFLVCKWTFKHLPKLVDLVTVR